MSATNSNRRQKQAEITRQEILAAARTLFASKGYAATTMSAIAKEAQTAVQTIYDSVGQKHAILLALVEFNERQVGVDAFQRQLAETRDPAMALSLYVALTQRFMEVQGDIFVMMMNAAPIEPEVDHAWRMSHEHHRFGAHEVARAVARLGGLRSDVTVEQAGDTIGLLTWGMTWLQLTRDYGWEFGESAEWITDSLVRLLLPDIP